VIILLVVAVGALLAMGWLWIQVPRPIQNEVPGLKDEFPLAFMPGLDPSTWDREFGNLFAYFQCRIPAWEWDWSAVSAQYAFARDCREAPWPAFLRLAELQGLQLLEEEPTQRETQ